MEEASVAATVFEIIGAMTVVLGVLITIVVLFLMNKGLKSANRALEARKGDFSKDLRASLEGLDDAQGQLEAMSSATEGVKAGMQAAVSAADRLVSFLKSSVFQVGVPTVLWVLLVFIAVPRGLRGSRAALKKKKKKKIPPPSWEAAAELLEAEGSDRGNA
jgi:hypothetical protein